MPTRSLRPTCPACGFPVFNRRYPKCEKCRVALPDALVYTPVELTALRASDRLDEQARERRRARETGQRATRGLGLGERDGPASLIVDIVELGGDLLGSGG